MLAKPHLQLVAPTGKTWKVPGRKPNKAVRSREYLTEAETERLMNAARKGRWGHRDATCNGWTLAMPPLSRGLGNFPQNAFCRC